MKREVRLFDRAGVLTETFYLEFAEVPRLVVLLPPPYNSLGAPRFYTLYTDEDDGSPVEYRQEEPVMLEPNLARVWGCG